MNLDLWIWINHQKNQIFKVVYVIWMICPRSTLGGFRARQGVQRRYATWRMGCWAMAGKATYQIPRLGNMGLSWIRMIRLDLWCLRFLFRASPFLAVHNPGWIPIFSVEILLSIVGYQQIPTNLSLAVFCASRHGAEASAHSLRWVSCVGAWTVGLGVMDPIPCETWKTWQRFRPWHPWSMVYINMIYKSFYQYR